MSAYEGGWLVVVHKWVEGGGGWSVRIGVWFTTVWMWFM